MFPLSALDRGAILPLDQPLPETYAMHGWLVAGAQGIEGFLGLTRGGILLPQAPGFDWSAIRPTLAGREVETAVGPEEQVLSLICALGLDRVPRRADKSEPGFGLDLDDLMVPDCADYTLHQLTGAQRALAEDWRAQYLQRLSGLSPDEAAYHAAQNVDDWIIAGEHRVLFQGDSPVAMTGFNARLPKVVQVGGVFTPSALRGRGHARRAVALHLAEARAAGIRRAVLFAASAEAVRAYEAIGFRRRGTIRVTEFPHAQRISPCP